jgi:histidine kinase
MLIIPIILSLLAGIVIGHAYLGGIKHGPKFDLRNNPIEKLFIEEVKVFEEIKLTMTSDPDKLLDIIYLEKIDKKVNIVNTGLVVRRGDTVIYVSKLLNEPEIASQLPNYRNYSNVREDSRNNSNFFRDNSVENPIIIGNSLYSIKQLDFYFSDHTPGSIFSITDAGPIGNYALKFFLSWGLVIVLILIVTNGVLTFVVSRSITKPIEFLKRSAEQIKEGNLGCSVKCNSNDEIGQLCLAFEEMRLKLKESIERQLQYEDNRKELISSISHDLKTPITSIKGYTEGILDGVADSPEKIRKYIKTIHTKAIDVDKLIDELFLYSKLDMQKEPFNFERVDIKEYLEHCIEELQFDLDKDGLELDLQMDAEPVLVIADREKLKRVVTNIIANSVNFMDKENGKIRVTLRAGKESLIIQIEDNGPGIPNEALPFIFSRFYRVESSRSTSAGGNGLGLAIAKRIIEGHEGKIWVESQEGLGTSIFFTLKKAVG